MKNFVPLLLIVSLSLFSRIFWLDGRPAGFTWDEAALGYNAYSLAKTGRDEHGQIMPLIFKSFGDYKPGLYVYASVLPVRLFGLNEFAVRLPSALFGTLLVVVAFLLTRQLFGQKHGLYAAFTTSLMPWAIHFSRGAWEANVSLVFTALATLLFIKRSFMLSALFFGLTFWTYQGAKLFTPLILLALLLIYRSRYRLSEILRPALLGVILVTPIFLGLASQSGRLKVFSVFSYFRQPETVEQILKADGSLGKDLIYYLYHSETLDQIRGIIQRYLNHFSPRYLFFSGDWSNPRQATPFVGYMYIPEIITLALGLRFLIRLNNPHAWLILLWLALAPVPSALSRDIVSAVRSLPQLFPLAIISALGLAEILSKKVHSLVFSLALAFFVIYFFDLYFVHSQHYTAEGWLYPYKPALTIIANHLDDYEKVIISPKLGQPYIFTLFYLKIDPRKFQSEASFIESSVGDVGYVPAFGKFIFRPIYWPNDRNLSSTLFVGDQYELPESDLKTTPNILRLSEINYPNGSPALKVIGLPKL